MKLMMLLVVAGMVMLQGCQSYSDYLILGGGGGGKAGSGNFTMEALRVSQNPKGRDSLIGLGGTIIFNGDSIPSDYENAGGDWSEMYSLEQQWGTLENEGIRQTSSEMGLFGKCGIELVEDTGVFGTVFGGVTFARESQLYWSSLGTPHYYVDKGTNNYGLYGMGISYIPNKDGSLLLQVDYDNRRGITFGLGWKF